MRRRILQACNTGLNARARVRRVRRELAAEGRDIADGVSNDEARLLRPDWEAALQKTFASVPDPQRYRDLVSVLRRND